MLTDYHCHLLPGIDDGSKNTEMSLKMLDALKAQGVERVIATPHFYAHREKSVDSFLERRGKAAASLGELDIPVLYGAEVAVEHGLCELPGIERLAVGGTPLILLELPYMGYAHWMTEEIYNISCEFRLIPVIAHVHRYLEYYSSAEMETILNMDAVFQINNEAFGDHKGRSFVKRLLKEGRPLVYGSDSHNLTSRKPNFDLLLKKARPASIEESYCLLDRYLGSEK